MPDPNSPVVSAEGTSNESGATANNGGSPEQSAADVLYGEGNSATIESDKSATQDEGDNPEGEVKLGVDPSKEDKPKEDEEPKDGEDDSEDEDAEIEYTVPEPPEGLTNNDALISDAKAFAKKHNLSAEAFNELATLHNRHNYESMLNAQATLQAQKDSWLDELRTEWKGNTYDANMDLANNALGHFASPELKAMLKTHGMTCNPAIIKHFHQIGKTMSEHNFITGNEGGGKPKSAADIFYPTMD